MEDKRSKDNETINKIFMDVAYDLLQPLIDSGVISITMELEFDNQQRIKQVNNLLVDGRPQIPSMNSIELANKRVADILKLPTMYRIKTLTLTLSNGKTNALPTYLY
ncbi:MAG: hypothetical protein V1905_00770 [bacterium]